MIERYIVCDMCGKKQQIDGYLIPRIPDDWLLLGGGQRNIDVCPDCGEDIEEDE